MSSQLLNIRPAISSNEIKIILLKHPLCCSNICTRVHIRTHTRTQTHAVMSSFPAGKCPRQSFLCLRFHKYAHVDTGTSMFTLIHTNFRRKAGLLQHLWNINSDCFNAYFALPFPSPLSPFHMFTCSFLRKNSSLKDSHSESCCTRGEIRLQRFQSEWIYYNSW